jgi:tRNA pseudouridine38-40 synthase
MQRYFIELSYNGTGYHGWQIQPNAFTVQECLDKALSVYFRQPVNTLGCGRTDAGVHATQFYAHFDLSEPAGNPLAEGNADKAQTSSRKRSIQLADWQRSVAGINSLLPYEIAVRRIFEVAPEAHARFDATERAYHYYLHFQKDPFKLDRSWLHKGPLNIEAMNEAAATLPGYTDFSCFSKSNTQTFTNNCRITEAFFETTTDGLRFTIRADRFLRNMVRAIMGTLIRIGKNEISLVQFREIIESKNRSSAGQSVPACGLYLVSVVYPYVK